MSGSSTTAPDRRSASSVSSESHSDDGRLERLAPTLAGPIRVTGFWLAVVLPIAHVPILATGLSSAPETAAFLVLLAGNLLALYLGHSHNA